jgi:hypothetical protein
MFTLESNLPLNFLSLTLNMRKPWVRPSFKQILIDCSQEYLNTTDKGREKTRTAMISRVADEIRKTVEGTEDTLPEELEKVQLSLMNQSEIEADFSRLSAHGSETKPADMLKVMAERNLKTTHVVIRLQQNPGLQSPSAEAYTQNRFLRFKYDSPVEVKRFSVTMALPSKQSLTRYLRRRKQTVRSWLLNGTQRNFLKKSNASVYCAYALPDSIANTSHRNSKKVTSKVAEWTRYMEAKTGAVFFILGAYTDEDGGLCISRYGR